MEDKKRKFFDMHAKHWDLCVEHKNHARVIEEIQLKKGAAVCDVGTGTGVLVPYIMKKISKKGKLIAIDYSSEMIKKAKEKWKNLKTEFLIADIHSTPFDDESFDYVICNACFPHFENKKKALKEIYRILKKGGTVVISHPTGKEFVNNLHKNTGGCIEKDMVPDGTKLAKTLEKSGFITLKVIDEPDFYFVSAKKPD
jgi:ubiquinone/menaquinone biosynthesis C-methylase UbiE